MAPKGSRKARGNATARAKTPTSVINRRLSLDWANIKVFISEHIRGLIGIYNVSSIQVERAWGLLYNMIFLDPVTTRHFSHFQRMWPNWRSRCSPFREWWAGFRSHIGEMSDKISDQMNDWRWDNPRTFGDQVNRSDPHTTSTGKV